MSEQETPVCVSAIRCTANFIFKRNYGRYFRLAILISLLCHFALILAMPARNPDFDAQEEKSMEAVDLPPEVVIPPPPQILAKPSISQMATEEVDEDITIDETTPPPPAMITGLPGGGGQSEGDGFLMVSEVQPKIKTKPPLPKLPQFIARAGVDVVTVIEFYVTETGEVDPRTRIARSSGWPALDELAVDWALRIKFFLALNRGEPVAVRARIPVKWISK